MAEHHVDLSGCIICTLKKTHSQQPDRFLFPFSFAVFFFLSLPPLDLSASLCLFTFNFSLYFTLVPAVSLSLKHTHTHTEFVCVSPGWSLAWHSVQIYLHLLSLSEDRVHNPTEGQWLTGSLASSAEIDAFYWFFSLATVGLAILHFNLISTSETLLHIVFLCIYNRDCL